MTDTEKKDVILGLLKNHRATGGTLGITDAELYSLVLTEEKTDLSIEEAVFPNRQEVTRILTGLIADGKVVSSAGVFVRYTVV